jgi:nucleoside-diphosphate-sugar epimerase
MRIMVTGDLGYIGSVLVPKSIERGHEVVGLDVGYFKDCNLTNDSNGYKRITCDLRDVVKSHFDGIDAVIHLGGLSNDPLGELSPNITYEINHRATVKFAEIAKSAGVKRFVYSSSQSMYGVSDSDAELDEYNSEKNPVTAYAAAKWSAEQALNKLNDEKFSVVSFRPSTVFGASPRLRTDIVFNNLVACAFTTGFIEIKSDGTPWRPIVHVQDVCQAFLAGVEAPKTLISGKAFNVGVKNGNYTVRQIAEAAARACPGAELTFTGEHSDPRTYKVCFDRIHNELAEHFKPEWDLEKGGNELMRFFEDINFTEDMFRGRQTVRLAQITHLIDEGLIDSNLRFIGD